MTLPVWAGISGDWCYEQGVVRDVFTLLCLFLSIHDVPHLVYRRITCSFLWVFYINGSPVRGYWSWIEAMCVVFGAVGSFVVQLREEEHNGCCCCAYIEYNCMCHHMASEA